MGGNSISALTASLPDTRCSCYGPRARNHKYLLWLQSKVLSVSRLFFSSPAENISDSASLKLYSSYIEDDITHFLYIYFRKSLFNALLCFAVPQLIQGAATGCLFQLSPPSLVHYLTGSYFFRCFSNFLFFESSLHQQCIAVKTSSGCASTRHTK